MDLRNVIVTIDKITATGHGLARVDGKTVFVAKTAPGDICEIGITREHSRHAFARVIRLIESGPHRTRSICPTFEQCGGCSMQMMSYEDQLQAKNCWIHEMWGRDGYQVNDIIAADIRTAYRNKAVYQVSPQDINDTGFFAEKSHQIIPHETCHLYPEVFSLIKNSFVSFFSEKGILQTPFRSLVIRTNFECNQFLVGVVTEGHTDTVWVDNLRGWATKVGQNLISERHDMRFNGVIHLVRGNDESYRTVAVIAGENRISTVMNGHTFFFGIESFFQNNIQAFLRAISSMKSLLGPERVRSAVELYSGVGVIAILLHTLFDSVQSVELNREAVRFARQNILLNAQGTITADCCDADSMTVSGHRDVVIVDPPRSGLSYKVVHAVLHTLRPRIILYLSCKPDTLLRDVRLLASDYEVALVQPFDFFPQTEHIEMLCMLRRREKD